MISLCEHCFNKKKEILEEKNPSVIRSLETFIYNCEFCKKTDLAITLKKELLRLRKEIYGNTHSSVVALQEELASISSGKDN